MIVVVVDSLDNCFFTSENKRLLPKTVNLIGEHTDYNDGFVLPCALPLVTVVVGNPTTDAPQCRIVTTAKTGESDSFELSLEANPIPKANHWSNYVRGVVANYHGTVGSNFNALIASSVPLGSGLSSSAALEVATYSFLRALDNNDDSKPPTAAEMAKRCQMAEHQYAFVPCGIMDQMIASMGMQGFALLLDCRSLDVQQIPLALGEHCLLVTNSNVKHQLSGSEYPERRQSCEKAAKLLGQPSLRTVAVVDIASLPEDDDTMRNRVRHVVGEIARTTQAAKALTSGDLATFGRLMNESHASLRDLYAVSCIEIDRLVSCAQQHSAVLGSRITGGGFGGCLVTLVRRASVDEVVAALDATAATNGQAAPTHYIATASSGSQVIRDL